MNTVKVAAFLHIFYPDMWPEMKQYVLNLVQSPDVEATFFINTVQPQLAQQIKAEFPFAHVGIAENQGKDIGGKLRLLQVYFDTKTQSDYMVFFHDKKSLHLLEGGNEWRRRLLTILERKNIPIIINTFRLFPCIGCIGNSESIIRTVCPNLFNKHLKYIKEYCNKFGLNNFDKRKFDFVGGTMFWVRSKIYEDFFRFNLPLSIRKELEMGIFDETYTTKTHALERILGYIVTDSGYTIQSWVRKFFL